AGKRRRISRPVHSAALPPLRTKRVSVLAESRTPRNSVFATANAIRFHDRTNAETNPAGFDSSESFRATKAEGASFAFGANVIGAWERLVSRCVSPRSH